MGGEAKVHESFLGQTACILAGEKMHRNFYMRGYTENYIPVCIPYRKN